MEKNRDCKVCEQLMKEKHRNDYVWKVLAIIFLAFSVVLAILYFGSGAITTETNVELDNVGNNNQIEGDGNIVVGSDGTYIEGTIERTDYTPIVCISIIAAAAIITAGGIVIAHHNKKDD